MRWTVSLVYRPYLFHLERGYAYLNGPPVPHKRIAYGSRHFRVKQANSVFVVVTVV